MLGGKKASLLNGLYIRYWFDKSKKRVICQRPYERKKFGLPRYHYLAYHKTPFFYTEGIGLWKFNRGEEVVLLNEYQFNFVLRHTKERNKIFQRGQAIYLTDLVRVYRSITQEEINNPELIDKNRDSHYWLSHTKPNFDEISSSV